MANSSLKVLQLIDSLDIGGAERMSVNLANALAHEGIESHLCATRRSGGLEAAVDPEVEFFVLGKRSSIDPQALWKLVRYIRRNRVQILHAHSTSIFTAVIVGLLTDAKVVWHDHNGNRWHKNGINKALLLASLFVDQVIGVNEKLVQWSKEHLLLSVDRVQYLPNFAELSPLHNNPKLPGEPSKRIICLSNLRYQKDHPTLLKAFEVFHSRYPDWHLLLVGEDRGDDYSAKLKAFIAEKGLENSVHILGVRSDSADILLASAMGVLSSESEGLPVALLEYGLAGLPVVVTNVGECAEVVDNGKCGMLVPSKDPDRLAEAMSALAQKPEDAKRLSEKFQKRIRRLYAKEAVIDRVLKIYRELLDE